MNPVGFASSIPAVPASSRSFQSSAPVSQHASQPAAQPFAAQYQSAKAAAQDDDSEPGDRKPTPVRKAAAAPQQSTDPKGAKPEDQVAPVQIVLAQVLPQDQPVARILSISLSGAATSLESLFGSFHAIVGAPDSTSRNATSQDAASQDSTSQDIPQSGSQSVSQLAPVLPPVAFSLNLQRAGPSDQKPTGPASPNGSTGQQQNMASGSQVSLAAGSAAGGSENPPPDNGSNQPGPQGDNLADPKPALASLIKQDAAPAEAPVAASAAAAPVQALVSTATHSTMGNAPKQSSAAPVGDASPAAPAEPAAPSAPAQSRQVDLTVPNDAGHPVDIRISQRGDDVQVTVRTPDGILAQSLRHNLPELSESLSRTGLRDEVLHTAQSHSSADGDSGERDRGGETPQRDDTQQNRQTQQERGRLGAKGQSNSQATKSFAEAIHVQERII